MAAGLGASLTLQGASVTATSDIILPSGLLTVRATNGDVSIGGRVNLNGSAAEIMRRVDGSASIAAIVADLQQAFSATDLGADVLAALALARSHGWIEVRDAA